MIFNYMMQKLCSHISAAMDGNLIVTHINWVICNMIITKFLLNLPMVMLLLNRPKQYLAVKSVHR